MWTDNNNMRLLINKNLLSFYFIFVIILKQKILIFKLVYAQIYCNFKTVTRVLICWLYEVRTYTGAKRWKNMLPSLFLLVPFFPFSLYEVPSNPTPSSPWIAGFPSVVFVFLFRTRLFIVVVGTSLVISFKLIDPFTKNVNGLVQVIYRTVLKALPANPALQSSYLFTAVPFSKQ